MMNVGLAYIILNNAYSLNKPYDCFTPVALYCTSKSCSWCNLYVNSICYIGIVSRSYKKLRKEIQ